MLGTVKYGYCAHEGPKDDYEDVRAAVIGARNQAEESAKREQKA